MGEDRRAVIEAALREAIAPFPAPWAALASEIAERAVAEWEASREPTDTARDALSVEFVDPRYFARMCLNLGDEPAVEITLRDDTDEPHGPFVGCARFIENEDGVVTVTLTEVTDPEKLVIGVYLDAIKTMVLT
jgi:hypothetical protein